MRDDKLYFYTEIDEKETNEIKLKLQETRWIFIPLYCIIIFSLILLVNSGSPMALYAFIALLILLGIDCKINEKYIKMLKIAKINDLERHKTKVRFMEELELKKKYANELKQINTLTIPSKPIPPKPPKTNKDIK